MKNPSPAEKDILSVTETIGYFVLSARKFYKLLADLPPNNFIVYYGSRKMIIRSEFAKYLEKHPTLRRRE